ncbi:MAG: hypothetical protein ACI3WS_02620 [Phascolarctobacterium sp.]
MAKNLMPEVLKMLGVEYSEKFKLHAQDCEVAENGLFYFTEKNELIKMFPTGDYEYVTNKIYDILIGYYKVVKLPWKPTYNGRYYSVSFGANGSFPDVRARTWLGDGVDCMRLHGGFVYRTKEEAEANFAEDYEKLTGMKLEG